MQLLLKKIILIKYYKLQLVQRNLIDVDVDFKNKNIINNFLINKNSDKNTL